MSQNIQTSSIKTICKKCGREYHDIIGEPREYCTYSCKDGISGEYIKKGGSRWRRTICRRKNCKMCNRNDDIDTFLFKLVSIKI